MADTALTIITDALLDLGVLSDMEVPTASQAAGALRKFNNMIDSWNLENLAIYGSTENVAQLVAGKQMYTVGVGGDMDIPRPNNITSIAVRDTTLPKAQQIDYPLYMLTNLEWQNIALKGLEGMWPNMAAWVNHKYPLLEVHVYPNPTTSNFALVIWDDGIINEFKLHDVVNLAPGYKRALTSNLAIELAASYGVEVPESVMAIAVQSKADIKTKNLQLNELRTPSDLSNERYNIYTDYYNKR